MSGKENIELARPDIRYLKSYLEAAKEFSKDKRSGKGFAVANISGIKRYAYSLGLANFKEEIINPATDFKNPETKKICITYWIIKDNQYIGEVCIKDKPLEKNTFLKDIAVPQRKWNDLYGDKIERYTVSSVIIRPSAGSIENMSTIMGQLFDKLREHGFNEFVMNCSKNNELLLQKLEHLSHSCNGRQIESPKTVEFIIPVEPEKVKFAIKEKDICDFIRNARTFEELILGLKERLAKETVEVILKPIKNVTVNQTKVAKSARDRLREYNTIGSNLYN